VSELVHIDPLENPEQANAQIAAILADSDESRPTGAPKPTMEPPPDSRFKLPGTGQAVEVRELTGADEEALAKVQGSFYRWISAMLELAVDKIDNKDADPDAVGNLLTGDRDYLLMAIRKVTWGPEIEMSGIECLVCRELFDVTVHTDDIPIKSLRDPSEVKFTVALRNGRTANVRLPNGHDQAVYLAKEDASIAQRNTLLLQRCVESIADAHGVEMPVEGFPSMVREGLSLPDRTKLLNEINNRMPGARYNEVPVKCPDCGEETAIGIGPVALFPDLYLS
jgi:hypothetical protein